MAKAIVIDDNYNNQQVAKMLLEKLGVEAETSDDAQQSLAFVATGDYAVILLDWMMPEIDGIEFLQLLRESKEGKKIRVIMCSSKSGDSEQHHALQSGADYFLVKPLTSESIRAAFESVGVAL